MKATLAAEEKTETTACGAEIARSASHLVNELANLLPRNGVAIVITRLTDGFGSKKNQSCIFCRAVQGPALDNAPEVVTWVNHRPENKEKAEDTPVHRLFDVCAGEHCQVYPGLTEKADAAARTAIDETWGMLE